MKTDTWIIAGLLVIIPLLGAALMIDLPSRWGCFVGDGAVYYAMADSLAWDGDLQYTRDDLVRITQEWPCGPQGVLLVANDTQPDIIHYAKPVLYPFFASPFVRILQSNGMLVFNTLCCAGILLIGFLSFSTLKERPFDTVFWVLTFWMVSVFPAYIFSLSPDLFNASMVMAGILPWTRWLRHPHDGRPFYLLIISVFFLGLAAATRPPNAIFIVFPLWSMAEQGYHELKAGNRDRVMKILVRIMVVILCFAGAALLILWLTKVFTGQAVAHGGFRKRIVNHFPFESPATSFKNTGNEISTRSTIFVFHWSTLFQNLKYYFFGRFTGLVLYFFPAAAAIILALMRCLKKKDPEFPSRCVPAWIVLVGLILFHLIYIPSNYHGGSCSIGNRYLVSYLPAFFLLLPEPPQRRTIFSIAAMSSILSGSVALNPVDSMKEYREVSKRPAFSRFPLEITLLDSWPVDDPNHIRIEFDGYYAYFADDNQWGRELGGFWVRGDASASLILRCWKPVQEFKISIRNGANQSRIEGSIGDAEFDMETGPGQLMTLPMKPGNPTLFYNLYGKPSYCYPVRISSSNGFIPKFTEVGSQDSRYLGCFVQIEIPS
jgi:hypothetical protein